MKRRLGILLIASLLTTACQPALSGVDRLGAPGSSTTPPACDRHTASVELTTTPATNLSLGQYVVARVTLRNQGCLALGLPQYTLRMETDPPQPVLWPEAPEPIIHSLAVQPGGSDTAEFVLQASNGGQATLHAAVSFEVHIGYPGPAYWGSQTSLPVTVHVSPNVFLKPPDSYEPAAGICGEVSGDVVAIVINPDGLSPRCVKVTAQQKLKYINATGAPLRIAFWTFDVEIAPGGEHVFEMPVDNYLLPGVHSLGGAEVWLVNP